MVPTANLVKRVVEEHMGVKVVLVTVMALPEDGRSGLATVAAQCGQRVQWRWVSNNNAFERRGL